MQIRHKQTGEVLTQVERHSLTGVRLAGADLRHADLRNICLREADLSGAHLSGADLRGAMLTDCNLREAKLVGACLTGASITGGTLAKARLSRADLRLATLRRVYMRGCDLRHADLRGARLEAVDLEDAVLNHAVLRRAVFFGANLHGTNLTSAAFGDTALQCCGNLHEARGLHGISHAGPSWMDLQTLRASAAALPQIFLDGLGISRREADLLRTLYTGGEQQASVYVAAAPNDGGLAWTLVSDLRARNLPAWPQPLDGEGTAGRRRLRPGPLSNSRLVVVCCEPLLRSPEAAEILTAAIESERRSRSQVLFPIQVDDYLQSEEILEWADEQVDRGVWRLDWVRYLRSLYVADWSRWHEPQPYQAALEMLARDLQNPARR